MAIGDDFEIQTGKNIRYTGAAHGSAGAGYYTVLEFHQWLQDLADDASSTGDDFMDITRDTPTNKSFDTIINLINGYNIDDPASEHLYDGSIVQTNGDEAYDGIQVIAPEGTDVQIAQDGAILANDFWNSTPDGQTSGGLNRDVANGIAMRFMVKVRTAAADIDGRRLICQTRTFNDIYSEFKVNGTARGVNVVPLSGGDDLNNDTAEATVSGWTTITNVTEGYAAIDVDADGTDENYYSEWNRDTFTINQLYERLKWLTRTGSTSTLYGLNGELFRGITHEIDVDTPTGTWNAFEAVSWTGGTGQMLAIDSTTAPTKMWIQLLTGVAPTDNQTITGGTSAATADVNVTVTSRDVSTPFVGTSTGSAIIGAYGLGIEAADLSSSDTLFDLTDTQITPPNNVTFSVEGIVSAEDYVLVGPEDGAGGLDLDQLTLNTTLSTATETSVVVTTTIPSDTPSSGTIRIELDSGKYRKVSYDSYSGSTFTIPSTDFSADPATAPKNVFVSYLDLLATATTESFTTVYSADRTLFVRVRDGGGTPIKTFETTATLGSAGGSATAVRTSDA